MLKNSSLRASLCAGLLLASLVSISAFAQATKASPVHSVVAAASVEQVRFIALGEVYQLRLEVFSAVGARLFDSEFQPGNLLVWKLHDQVGQRLRDGDYRCVVTTKTLVGQTSQKHGLLLLQAEQVTLQAPGPDAQAIQAADTLPTLARSDFLTLLGQERLLPLTLLAHDGEQGRVVSGRGGLSFHTGDFFAGKDHEQMRLTAEGKLGLGVSEPQAKLDVAGLIRTSEGIVFPDGSMQTTAYVASGRNLSMPDRVQRDAQGRSVVEPDEKEVGPKRGLRFAPSVTTAGRLAKFNDNAGTLTDSVVTELANGRIGVSNTSPNYAVEVGNNVAGEISTMVTNANSGTGSFAGIGARNGTQPADTFRLLAMGTNWTSTGAFVQDAGVLQAAANLAGGMSILTSNPSGAIRFYAGGQNERLRIDQNGNVGIGTPTPGSKLTVAGLIESTSGGIKFPDGSTQLTAASGGVTSVTASAPLASSGGTTPNISLTGVVGIANGGTGTSSGPTAAGQFLRSTGSGAWGIAALVAGDIPDLGASYIKNGTSQQASSNFNISGDGTAGGTLSGNIVNATTRYDIGGSRVLSVAGTQNLFAGVSAGQNNSTGLNNSFVGNSAGSGNMGGNNNSFFGTFAGQNNTTGYENSFVGVETGSNNTTGGNNSFFGRGAGLSNTTESKNTFIGYYSDGQAGITNATAIGSQAKVTQSNSLVLGSINGVNEASADTNVGIGTTAPTQRLHVVGNGLFTGNLTVNGSFTGSVAASSLSGVVSVANGGTGASSLTANNVLLGNGASAVQFVAPGTSGNLLKSNGSTWTSAALSASDIPDLGTSYIKNQTAMAQTAGFNISGSGTLGGTLSSNIVNATTQYNINASRVLSVAGTNNLFAGVGAGISNSGSENTFVGNNAGFNNMLGNGNSFFGSGAGASNTSAGNNSFFGGNAGFSNTTGTSNSFFGYGAGYSTVGAGSNSFFGSGAGYNNTGSSNSFFGESAGLANTTACCNSFFGNAAGNSNTTGAQNSFFGWRAGLSNTTACCNSFFGYNAGNTNATGASNSFFGHSAGSLTSTGTQNSFFGTDAGRNNTTGGSNSFFGSGAGQGNSTGLLNSFFGYAAGNGNSTGGSNSFFGYFAGISNGTESNNTFVGAFSDVQSASSITNATAIGYRAKVTQSNSLVLGSINGVNSATADTKVGIGTTAPAEKLHVQGGNIYVGAAGQGIILKSPDGNTCKLLTIDNSGAIALTTVTCP